MNLYYEPPLQTDISIALPSSKSISNRALIIQALSSNNIEIQNLSTAEDTVLMHKNLIDTSTTKHVGIAGTTARFLTAYYATQANATLINAASRMQERPMDVLCKALERLGAKFVYHKKQYSLPYTIDGSDTKGGKLTIDATKSSQFISALMLIAPTLKNGLELHLKGTISSAPYISMTANILRHFGIDVIFENTSIKIPEQVFQANTLVIENDWSSASYIYSIAALQKNKPLRLENLSKQSWQGDNALSAIYYRLGVKTIIRKPDIILEKSEHKVNYLEYDFTDCPDVAQTVICTCVGLGIEGTFTGLHTLKHKETDRITALKIELKKLRWDLTHSGNGAYYLKRSQALTPFTSHIKTYNDHRMAMAFAPLTIKFKTLSIENPSVVKKSFPDFWGQIAKTGIKQCPFTS